MRRIPRMTTRRWMVLVAAVAAFIAGARALTRPIPEPVSLEVGTGRIFWSDGVLTSAYVGQSDVPRPVERKHLLFCRLVRWSDGSSSLRLP